MAHLKTKSILSLIGAAVMSLLSGCSTFGPSQLPSTAYNYNVALSQNENQQLLLNLVRMKYSDSPYFLSVSTVSSNMKLNASLQGRASFEARHQNNGSVTRTTGASITPDVSYTSNPTVIYVPVTGEKLTRQFLIPVNTIDVAILMRTGWSLARIFRVTAQQIGDYENAEGATRPGVSTKPANYKDFIYIAHALRAYQNQDAITERLGKYKNTVYIDMILKHGLSAKLAHMLHLPVGTHHIKLLPTDGFYTPPGFVHIKFRSIMGIMYYLSKGINAPAEDYQNGILQATKDKNGQFFSWFPVLRGMMQIYSAPYKPENAEVAVRYRQRWFYIADTDNNSKETLVLLGQLMSLQARRGPSEAPGININV